MEYRDVITVLEMTCRPNFFHFKRKLNFVLHAQQCALVFLNVVTRFVIITLKAKPIELFPIKKVKIKISPSILLSGRPEHSKS